MAAPIVPLYQVFPEEPMRHVYRVVAAAALFLILTSLEPVAGQELTAAEEALIKAETQRHVERY